MTLSNDTHDSDTFSVKMVDEDPSYSPLMYEELPQEYQRVLDDIATEILDPQGGHLIVTGSAQAGKTSLINQIIGNVDRYLDKLGRNNMVFVNVDEDDMDDILGLSNRYTTYVSSLMKNFEVSEYDICYVTEYPEIAERLFGYTKKARIILEASQSFMDHLIHTDSEKFWGSWRVMDVDDLIFKKKDLIDLLHMSLNEKIKDSFKVDLTKQKITQFVNYCLRNIPELLGEGEQKKYILVPLGIWAVVLRRLGGILGLSESPAHRSKNGVVFSKVIQSVFEDNADILEQYAPRDEMPGIMIASPDGKSRIRVQLPPELLEGMQSVAGQEEEQAQVVNPIKFNKISTIDEKLRSEIIGQESAVESVVEGLVVPAAGLNDENKPLKSMLFLGPTGTGKTKMSLTLAEIVGETKMNVVRLDMSEYSQAHEASKLLGAPPGYAGFDKGGDLTNAVKKNPNSLILLDEIEKAHPKIWDSFLQILDAGRMTDGLGDTVDFTQTIIIMTSNLGASDLAKKSAGFNVLSDQDQYDKRNKDARSIIKRAVEKEFRTEFINRIDDFVIFNELSLDTARQIVRKEIDIINERMSKRGFKLETVGNDIIDEILSKSDVAKYGAREIQRTILRTLSSPIAKSIMSSDSEEPATFTLELDKDNTIVVNTQ